jgi:hypothetical protein
MIFHLKLFLEQMIGMCLLALVSTSIAAITKAPTTKAATPTPASAITIDPKLRKALLEALTNYDGDESTEASEESTTAGSVTDDYDEATNHPSFVKIHTFAIDGDKSDENEVIKTIIISRPRTTLTPPKTNSIAEKSDQVHINFKNHRSPDPVNEENDGTDNIQLVRSVESRNSGNGNDKKDEKLKKKASEKSATKPVTPSTTTTTTLPPPVTNADGENIEKVAKEDVKIQQAPLLAAFTVQQDVHGTPKKVISLFRNPEPTSVNSKIINMEFKASQPIPSAAPTSAPSTTTSTTAQANQQLLSSFEFKQRQLEDQIRFLQARQREQEEIIRRHQQLQDQQNRQNLIDQQRVRFEDEQRQRQRFDDEQRQRQQRFEQEQQALLRQQQSQQVQQPQTQALQAPPQQNSNVQFIQSIPLGHTVGISVEQQLPFKGPSEFNPDKPELQKSFSQLQQQFQHRQFQRQNLFQQQQQQQQQQLQLQQQQQQQRNAGFGQPFAQPLIQQQQVQQIQAISPLPSNLELPVSQPQSFAQFTPLPTTLELPQRPFQTFNSAPLSILPSITEIAPQGQNRNRVFRQDASQTGNFGLNNGNNNNFQIQQQQLINPVDSLDSQIQNIFLQSGLNTRSADDFRIISKILALNHGVPNNLLHQQNSGRFQ